MRVIYVAGPYHGESSEEIQRNIMAAEKVAVECWKRGWAVLCPHKNTAGFEAYEDDVLSHGTWIRGDMEMLSRCDAVVLVNNKMTKGVKMELDLARSIGLDIYMSLNDVPDME